MNKFIAFLLGLALMSSTNAQYTFEVFYKHGIYFKVGPRLDIEELKENGKSSLLFGSTNYRVRLLDLSYLPVPTDINYKGKTYNYNHFAGQLQPYFNATRVVDASMQVYVDGLEDCKAFSLSFKTDNNKTLFCKPIKDKRATITGFKLSDIQVVGINELQRKIDELEKAVADKEKKEKEDKEKLEKEKEEKERLEKEKQAELEKKAEDEKRQKEEEALKKKLAEELEAKQKLIEEKAEETKKKTDQLQQVKSQLAQQKTIANQVYADSIAKVNKQRLEEKWREDSIYYDQQRKMKAAQKSASQQLSKELTDDYEKKLGSAFEKAKARFALLSSEEQAKACQQAEGFAANAALFADMKDFDNSCKLYQQAALTCPTHPMAEFSWLIKSVTDFSGMMNRKDREEEKAALIDNQKKELRLLEINTAYSNAPFYQLYEKYQIEQGYRKLYEQAKADADQFYNQFSKMSDVSVKFTDPSSLNQFVNTRIAAVDANYRKSLQAAGIKAGAEFDQTYAQTGNANTAAAAGAISGATDMLANSILAAGAKKRLREERELQLNDIAQEFVVKLNENMNYALRRMLTAQTKEEDERAYSDFLYNYYRFGYACSNFSYTNNSWFYNSSFSTTNDLQPLKNIVYKDAQPELQAAQRKLFFASKLAAMKLPSCGNISVYVNWQTSASEFTNEAEAWVSKGLRVKPESPAAYDLLSQIDPSTAKQFQYALTAAQYAANSSNPYFTNYRQKTVFNLSNFINYLINEPNAENQKDWSQLVGYQLYQFLPKEKTAEIFDRLIREEKVSYLKALIDQGGMAKNQPLLHGFMLDAIRLNKPAVAALISFYMPANQSFTLNGQQLNYWQLAVLENKPRAFAGMTRANSNFNQLANEMKPFEGLYAPEQLLTAFANAAIRYNITAPLDYIKANHPDFLGKQKMLVDSTVALGGRIAVIAWFSNNGYMNKDLLSRQLTKAKLYWDIQNFLTLGADINVSNDAGSPFLLDRFEGFIESRSKALSDLSKLAYDKNMVNLRNLTFTSQQHRGYVSLFLEYKPNLNIKTFNQKNIFHAMAILGDVQVAKRMLSYATKELGKQKLTLLNEQDAQGNTPLHSAIASGNTVIATLFIQEGADDGIKNNKGLSARKMAAEMQLEIPELDNMSAREKLHFALTEENFYAPALNKRAIGVNTTAIQPIAQLYNPYLAQHQHFLQKQFAGRNEILSTSYFASTEFLEVIKYKLLNRPILSKSYSIEKIWMIENFNEIKSLSFLSIKPLDQYDSEFAVRFEISLVNGDNESVKMTAQIETVLMYQPEKKTFVFGNGYEGLYGGLGQIYALDVRLAKTIQPGETNFFYKPERFEPSADKLRITDLIRNYYAKEYNKAKDAINKYYYQIYQEDDYNNLQDLSKKWSSGGWYPEFVAVENRSKSPITVVAYWK